jgi:PAS domain S-box-containing protein
MLANSREQFFFYSSLKGWLFVSLTSLLIYVLLRQAMRHIAKSQQHLAEKEHRLKIATQAGGIGVWDLDLKTDTLVWDERMRAMYGRGSETFGDAYELWKNSVHPEDQERADSEIRAAIQHHTGFDTSFRIVRPDGEVRHVRSYANILYDAAGNAVRMIGTNQDMTERVQIENKLHDSLALFNASQSVGHIGSWEYDIAEDKNTWSDEMCRIFGIQPGDPLTGWEGMRQKFPEDWDRLNSVVQAAMQGTPYEEDFRIVRPDGTVRWGRTHGVPVQDDNGSIVRLVGTVQDITERKQAEEELRLNEEKFRTVVENATDIIYQLTPEGVFTFLSPNAVDLMGYTPAEMLGDTFAKFVHPDDRQACRDFLSKVYSTGEQQSGVVYRVKHKNGSLRWHSSNGAPVKDREGHVVSYIGISRDITEQKEAEEKLATSLKLLNESQAVGHTGSWEYEIAEDRITWSDEMYRIAGIDVGASLPGWQDMQSAFPEDWERLNAAVQRAIQGTPYEEDFRILWKDGTVRWARVQGSPVRDENGNVVRLIGTTRDITERKQIESQLLHSQKMESVGRLAGGVAHDFNNMLGVILGNCELIMPSMKPDQPQYNRLTSIKEAAQRSADLTRQLLAFARKQTVKPRVISLNETVESMLKMLQRLIGEHIGMAWIPGDELWSVRIDPGQIDQILANLCVNARDAIQDSGMLTIQTENAVVDEEARIEDAPPGEYVLLTVRDDGCGMESETLSKISEPFFTTKEMGKGTGLGLATVYGIVKQNEGFLTVTSAPGQGTTFSIYLPRHKSTVRSSQQSDRDSQVESGHETILLVEDEKEILQVAGLLLQSQGYTVIEAPTPAEAIQRATDHPGDIHLLITDVVMPEVNGKELAKKILSLYPGIKCLFMSGYTADIIGQHGLMDEEVHFIQKPFLIGDFTRKLREVLDGE